MNGESFGDRLRRIRLKRGISQAALAKAAKCDQASISKWQDGVCVPGKVETVFRLAYALNIDSDLLFKTLNPFERDGKQKTGDQT